MKKLRISLISILTLITILFSVTTVFAKNTEYNLKDLGMSVKISDALTVKTRDNSNLPKGIYLEAVNEDNSLRISIAMDKNESTQEVDSFANQSAYYLEEIKVNLENEGLGEIKDANYGSVPFLDYMQTIESDDGKADILELHSITCVNGMTIAIVSQTTLEQVSIIDEMLKSIQFETIEEQPVDEDTETKKGSALPAIFFICGGVTLAIIIVVIVKKNVKRKKILLLQQQIEKKNNSLDSDFADNISAKKNISGYKTSSDYFDESFDKPSSGKKAQNTTAGESQKSKKTGAVTRMGYFAKNLGRELKKSKKNGKKNSSKKAKRKAEDYDIFNEK